MSVGNIWQTNSTTGMEHVKDRIIG